MANKLSIIPPSKLPHWFCGRSSLDPTYFVKQLVVFLLGWPMLCNVLRTNI